MSTGKEHEEYIESMIKGLIRMKKETMHHMPTCACHICIYKRDIETRHEIKSKLHRLPK